MEIELGNFLGEQLVAINRLSGILGRPKGRAQGFEVGGFSGHGQGGQVPAQFIDHGLNAGGAPDYHYVIGGNILEQFENLPGHHPAEARHYLTPRHPPVGGVGAITFAENRTAAGHLVRLLVYPETGGFLETHIQAAGLLDKEFTSARGALVPGEYLADASHLIQLVDNEGLTSGADDGIIRLPFPVYMGQGQFHRQGLGDVGDGKEFLETPAGHGYGVGSGQAYVRQYVLYHLLGISLMGT